MPSIQFVPPSSPISNRMKTDATTAKTSGTVNSRSIGHPKRYERKISTGATKSAICRLEPIAMPTLRSILFFIAMSMAVECSAALPTIATTITPTKTSVRPTESRTFSIVPTRNSESSATKAVAMSRMVMTLPRDHCLSLSSTCSSALRKRCLWVRERETEHAEIGKEQDNGDRQGALLLDQRAPAAGSGVGGEVKHRRDDETDRGQRERDGGGARCGAVETLFF